MAKQKVTELILTEPARTHAARALNQGAGFKGPRFVGGETKVSAGFVSIKVDGITYSYPFHTVARVKEYTEEVDVAQDAKE